jgi:dipeptidyl aminopeptidase/acylaminoacyl peptidase
MNMGRIALAALALVAPAVLAATAMAQVERVEKGNLVIESIPEIPPEIIERLNQYQNTRSASFRSWTADGRGILITTRFGEVNQLHKLSRPLGARRQMTFYPEPVGAAAYRPGPDRTAFYFQKDVGGNENFQLFYFDEATGRTNLLSDGTSRNGAAVWSRDGALLAYQSNRRDSTNWDIYVVDPDDRESIRMVFEGEGYWLPLDFSPDGSKLAILKYTSITNSNLAILDLENGQVTPVEAGPGIAFYGQSIFSPSGNYLYFISDHDNEFRTLRRYNLSTGRVGTVSGDISWNVDDFDLSPDGEFVAFATNADGRSELQFRRLNAPGSLPSPKLPPAVISGLKFSPNGSRLAFTVNQATSPADVYTYNFAAQRLTRWTASEVGGLDTAKFSAPALVHYPTFDEADGKPRMIPAFVYRPSGPGPHPVLVNIHGGPESQARPVYSAAIQYWINELGFAVIRPNVRGSAGYGKTYVSLDNGFKREGSVRDIGALLDWLANQPDLDQNRVVVYGGSYGGYMVLASMVHYSDRLLGAVDIVGISNFVTFLRNTRSYRRDLRRAEYGDERDPEMRAFQERISPTNNTGRITKPLFIIQGLNDPRVPVTESEQMLEKVRKRGTPVWYLMAKDEGHGFKKKSNRDYMAASVALFLTRLLAPGETP